MDEDDNDDEIVDEEAAAAEYIFSDPFIAISSDDSSSSSENADSLSMRSSNNSRSVSESQAAAAVAAAAASNLSGEEKRLIAEFSADKLAKELRSRAGAPADLATALNKHWKVYAPICFSAIDVPSLNLIETDAQRILLKPLEVFICDNMDSDAVLAKLSQLDDPPMLCGKVFKAGEPSYFCR